jgi:ethanolaminephosphotransferase
LLLAANALQMPPRPDDNAGSPKITRLDLASKSLSSLSVSSELDGSDGEIAGAPTASGFFYLSAAAQRNLPRFQYQGRDLSLLYNYVLSPLAGRLVDLLPRSVAPNTITLVGLLFMASSYVVFWYHCPFIQAFNNDFAKVPRWIFLWNCFSMILYQTFDNMDGKQARRTKSTSPLGLLFDHGCDAINSLFGSTNWMIAMALNPRQDSWGCWVLLLGPYALFFVGTWEEYHTGRLVLPIINGPNEGLLGGALLSFASFWWGPTFWQQMSWSAYLSFVFGNRLPVPTLRNADWVVWAALLGFSQECVLKISSVVRRYSWRSATSLVPFIGLFVCTWVHMVVIDDLWINLPRTFLHLVASLFVEMTTALMLAHMCRTPYQPLRWTLLPFVVLTALSLSSRFTISHDIWVGYTVASCSYLSLKTCLVVREICELLQIYCFNIVTKRAKTTKST